MRSERFVIDRKASTCLFLLCTTNNRVDLLTQLHFQTRLLEIKALEDKGQQLEAEQLVAVKKLDSVVEMIDLLKDIGKSVSDELSNVRW